LAFRLLNAGDLPRSGGWVARAQRVYDGGAREDVGQGYLLYLQALRTIFEGDGKTASLTFERAAKIGERFRDLDLLTLARHGQGRAFIYLGRIAEGMALLDEAMLAVTAGDVSPIVVGDTYCSVIEACQQIFDVRRAQVWTAALTDWCSSMPELAPYRGQCLVHRAEILQLRGEWRDAVDEVLRATQRLSHPAGQAAVGAAWYQQAELHRLHGELAKAEGAYRRASEHGRDPQPGLALLRLAQGRVDAAAAAIRRALDEAADRVRRASVLPALVEIMLTADDTQTARAGAEELSDIAAQLDAPLVRAFAAQAIGAVLLGVGDARAALGRLREACGVWRELEAPYEMARVRVRIGLACRALGDTDTAELEFAAARTVFERLKAATDLAHLDSLTRNDLNGDGGHGLTRRELQVLRLVARGETNKAIGATLGLSDRTIDRHVSNIFAKLGVSSRTAATAYAYEHDLV
jgi:DNA-binding CsgD family transcriptional regulator